MTRLYHDSRKRYCREPFGALPAGESVRLRLMADETYERAWTRLWHDGAETRVPMTRAGAAFEATIETPEKPGLLWYYFIAEDATGQTTQYGNAKDDLGGEGAEYVSEPPSFQITLFDPAYDTPAWMRESALYQIFPDRFASAKPNDPAALAAGCHYHANWSDAPDLTIDGGDNAANDFFGGDLAGITKKLPYLAQLGIGCIYLNPVFKAVSNHKYDTGDYSAIDPSFGTESDFTTLCNAARDLGIRVLLDGVFSHTGADSRYFDRSGTYGGTGAYADRSSPYFSWYRFERWPEKYDCWWGFPTLPNVNEGDEGFLRYILRGKDAIVPGWIAKGASGWRLDVADELPVDFIREMRRRVKSANPQAALLGEVWEDASRKVAYGETRTYCAGDTLDGVMNYPLRDALFAFLLGGASADQTARSLEAQREAYPKPFRYSLMNLLGSHDKPRAISALAGGRDWEPPREERRPVSMAADEYALGRARYLAALGFLAALPGMPSVYYGDEAGMTGMADPFCRGTYPWGQEDNALIGAVGRILRERTPVCKTGYAAVVAGGPDAIVSIRWLENGRDAFGACQKGPTMAFCLLNRSQSATEAHIYPGDVEGLPLDAPVTLRAEPVSASLTAL